MWGFEKIKKPLNLVKGIDLEAYNYLFTSL